MLTTANELDHLNGRLWDAIVVGAGPAGSVAARELARRGKSVLIVEKTAFPRWKVCGGCLSAAATATLLRLGLGHLVSAAVPLDTFALSCGRRLSRIRLEGNYAIARNEFDASLLQSAVEEGASVLCPVTARVLGCEPTCRWVQLATPEYQVRVAGRIVVLATGLGGRQPDGEIQRRQPRVDSLVGAGTVLPYACAGLRRGTIQMALGTGGYVGMVQLAEGHTNVAAAFSRKLLAASGNPAEAARRICEQASQPFPRELTETTWLGTPALSHRSRQVAAPRLFSIGDLAGYEEPFTGEGIAWAMQSACAVLDLACRAIDAYDSSLPALWSAAHHRLLARRMLMCGLIGRALRYPQLMRAATTVLSKASWLARPLVNSINRGCRVESECR